MRPQILRTAFAPTSRSIANSAVIRAATAAAPAVSVSSRPSASSTSYSSPRKVIRKVATPVSSKTSTFTPRTSVLASTSTLTPSTSSQISDEASSSLPDVESDIDDYSNLNLNLTPPPPSPSPSQTFTSSSIIKDQPTASPPLTVLSDGPSKIPITTGNGGGDGQLDWSVSYAGLGEKSFSKEVSDALLKPLGVNDVEIKPDGLLYMPEIKYRRTLNSAFGPGGWGLAPRSSTEISSRIVSREWALIANGRLVSIARGEQEYFDPSGIPTAMEACKSNALMRCCKDLGIASELWDPGFIREFKAKHCIEVFVEHITQKKKRKLWRKKDGKFEYPYKET